MSTGLDITVFENGPIKVSNAGKVRYCGADVPTDGDVFLCRCGESANAPFCDGTHSKIGFDGACETDEDGKIRVWEGRTLDTQFNSKTCMHVFYCKPLKELRARELDGDDAAATEIIKVVNSCPSGALSYTLKGECDVPEDQSYDCDIDIVEGGEIRVQGNFSINEPLLELQDANRATLCRCGLSKNKPWCDGRHKKKRDFR